LVVLLALPYFDHVPLYDELYSLLAARGWLATGEPVIADGAYPRAFAFTLLQAGTFSIFGESLVTARLPSLVCVALLAAALFFWVARQGGWLAAGLASVFFALTPLTITTAQFGRFYSLHALALWGGALLVYRACATTNMRDRVLSGAGAIACLLLAMHLQRTTVIALCALAVWAVAVAAANFFQSDRPPHTKRTVAVATIVAAVLAGAVVVWSGVAAELWTEFRTATFWGSVPGRAENIRFYHQAFDEDLGVLWSLFPIACVAAVASRRREMWFAASFVAITLVLHSLAAQKESRYVFYVLPFITGLLGFGLATIIRAYAEWARRALPSIAGRHASHPAVGWLTAGVVAVSVAFPLVNNPPVIDAARMLAGAPQVEAMDYADVANWQAELDVLRPLAEKPAILATSSGMHAIYYLGDFDFDLNANVVDETDTRRDFGVDERTGRQALASPESVGLLLRCYDDVVFVIDESRWSRDTAVPVATSALIEKHAVRVPTRPESALLVFRATNVVSPDAEFCKKLRPGRRS
jgi:hypothetical protein